MTHDTLSDVLRSVRLRSAVFFYVSCGGGKWAAEAPPSHEFAQAVIPGADRVIEYHVVTNGQCWAAIVGEPPLKLQRGDIIMLPQGDAHVLSSAPGMRADPQTEWFRHMQQHQRPFHITYDGVDPQPKITIGTRGDLASSEPGTTALVCGFIGCDMRPFNPLIASLPRLLHLPASSGNTWSEQFIQLAVAESETRRPGSDALLERLSEMMFVDAVRRHVDNMTVESTGWLAGLKDRFVGRTLALMHEKPSANWSIEELGNRVGLSRSALHDRFIQFVGQPPMQYLANWRMQLASQLLRESQSSVAAIATEVGYDSEAAFARAFKRMVGTPPATWRRMQDP